MAKQTDPLEIAKWGILLAGGYLVFKIFKGTGLIPSQQQTQADNLNLSVDQKEWTKPSFWKKPAPAGYEAMGYTVSGTEKLILDVYQSVGIFNDDEDKILGVLRAINYQTQYSFLADKFLGKYGKDMTSYIKDAFNAQELYPGWSHIEKLPAYRKK